MYGNLCVSIVGFHQCTRHKVQCTTEGLFISKIILEI